MVAQFFFFCNKFTSHCCCWLLHSPPQRIAPDVGRQRRYRVLLEFMGLAFSVIYRAFFYLFFFFFECCYATQLCIYIRHVCISGKCFFSAVHFSRTKKQARRPVFLFCCLSSQHSKEFKCIQPSARNIMLKKKE